MEEPNIRDILNSIPDLSYKAKKRKLEDYDSITGKEVLASTQSKDEVATTKSLADQAYDRLGELIKLAEEAEAVVDKVCKDISYPVVLEEDPATYNALSRLFGDDFTGVMTWGMYSQLLELQAMIHDDFAKGELERGS